MSDAPEDRSDIIALFPGADTPTLSAGGFFDVVKGGLKVILPSEWHYNHSGGFVAPITDANVLYRVTYPSNYGTLLLDGVATSLFTQQDIVEGRVTYQHDGSDNADNIYFYASITDVPRVPKPYTPHFLYDPPQPAGTTQGAFYAGILLHGTEPDDPPILDPDNWGSEGEDTTTGIKGIVTRAFFTTQPNEVIFLWLFSVSTRSTSAYAPSIPIATVTYPGLTFTRIGGGTFNTIQRNVSTFNYLTVTAELFSATSTTVRSTATLTATWAATGASGPDRSFLHVMSYYNLGNLSTPWGTNPASIQMYVTNTVPGAMNLNTTTDDQCILPVLFALVSGDISDAPVSYPPIGYSDIGGGSLFGDLYGSFSWDPEQRTGICWGNVGTQLPPPPGEIEPAEGPGCSLYGITEAAGAGPMWDPHWRLTLSDDGGRTWGREVRPRAIGPTGLYPQRLRWLKLGHSRERLVKLECTDPVRRVITGIYLDATEGMS